MAILVRLFYLSVSMVLCDEAGRPLCNAHWYRSGHVNWVGFEVNTCWWRLALTLQAILGLYREPNATTTTFPLLSKTTQPSYLNPRVLTTLYEFIGYQPPEPRSSPSSSPSSP